MLLDRSIFEEGTITMVHGIPGTGKTDFVLLLLKRAEVLGYNPVCNMVVDEGLDHDVLNSDMHLLNLFLEYGEKLFIVLDEANLFQSSKDFKREDEKNLERLLSVIRHLRASVVFVIQRRKNLLPMIREQSAYEIFKVTKKLAIVWLITGEKGYINDIPSCRELGVKYQTYSFAPFEFCLDLEKLLKDLTGITHKQQIEKLKEIRDSGYKDYKRT